MKLVLSVLATLLAMVVVFLFVGFAITYSLLFINFNGPESVAEHCARIGFSVASIASLALGFFVFRFLWLRYSAADPE